MTLVARLAAHSHWEKLRSEPGEFNAELDKVLDDVRMTMRMLYRVEDTLPARKEKRDREIWEAKEKNPRQSFTVIGRKRNLTRQAAREACKRQATREKKRLSSYVASLLAIENAREALRNLRKLELETPHMAAMGLAVSFLPKIRRTPTGER
jgi:hypothetical protein